MSNETVMAEQKTDQDTNLPPKPTDLN